MGEAFQVTNPHLHLTVSGLGRGSGGGGGWGEGGCVTSGIRNTETVSFKPGMVIN